MLGTRRSRRAARLGAIASAVAALASSCGDGDDTAVVARPIATDSPAATFAPLVALHPRERHWPMSARDFVDHASLNFSTDPCVSDDMIAIGAPRLKLGRDVPQPALDPRRLGGPRPYRVRPPRRRSCLGARPTAYATSQHTRPYDGPGRAPGLRPGEGFYFDLLTAKYRGNPNVTRTASPPALRGVPAYYEQRPARVDGRRGLRIDYWLLYGLESPLPEEAGDRLSHEGDWERVSVLAWRGRRPGRYVPVAVLLRRWGGGAREVPWQSLGLAASGDEGHATHPVLHAAAGSHTLYPSPGTRRLTRIADGHRLTIEDDAAACPDCVEWRTWRQLRPVRSEPWYGYGGGWGFAYESDVSSGPLGPYPR